MTRDRDPIQTDARKARRVERLGSDACCVLCGNTELALLVPVGRKLLEDHHVVGRGLDESSSVPLCRNCHAEQTESLAAVGATMRPPPTLPERVVSVLRALAAFFSSLGNALSDWADRLVEFINRLDHACPAWREEVAS